MSKRGRYSTNRDGYTHAVSAACVDHFSKRGLNHREHDPDQDCHGGSLPHGGDMASLTEAGLWALLRHAGRWLANLRRAGQRRRQESREALRAVIKAARRTRTYVRHLKRHRRADAKIEADLAELWTTLGFRLQDLGLGSLAKRCDIKGRFWADPAQFDPQFLARADVSLERIERLARELLAEIGS